METEITERNGQQFLLRHTLEHVLDAGISNEAKVFYARLFAWQLPKSAEFMDEYGVIEFKAKHGQRIIRRIPEPDKNVLDELVEHQFIEKRAFANHPTIEEFIIIPRFEEFYDEFPADSPLPRTLKSSDGLIVEL
jgi:hypothetical protein